MDLSWLLTPPRDYSRVRGPEAVDPEAAADRTRAFREPHTTVAGVTVPDPFFERGVTLQGTQGSGKTVTILWLLLPVLQRMAVPGNRQRLVVVDPKGDLASAVLTLRRAVCPAAPLHLLNPFDRLGSALDPAEFAGEPTAITRLVRALTYRNRDARTGEFFGNTARSHLVALIKVLQTRVPGLWGWRDLYHVATHYDLHRRVLRNSRHGRAKAAAVVRKTFAGVVNTVESWLGEYEGAFACWDRSPPFPLDAFLRGSGVLVLTVPEDQADSLSPAARTVLRAAKDRLLADTGRDPESRPTVVLDELADLEECVKAVTPLFGRGGRPGYRRCAPGSRSRRRATPTGSCG